MTIIDATAADRAAGIPKLQLIVREGNADALAFFAAPGLERQVAVTPGTFLT